MAGQSPGTPGAFFCSLEWPNPARLLTTSRGRCSSLRSNSATAAASAAFSSGASTVPRYCPRFLMIETRQLLSLAAAVGFFLVLFIGEVRGTQHGRIDNGPATILLPN